jgi:hypothetical protein
MTRAGSAFPVTVSLKGLYRHKRRAYSEWDRLLGIDRPSSLTILQDGVDRVEEVHVEDLGYVAVTYPIVPGHDVYFLLRLARREHDSA